MQQALMRNPEAPILIPTTLGYISESLHLWKEITFFAAAEFQDDDVDANGDLFWKLLC